jgi:hypothetical protein
MPMRQKLINELKVVAATTLYFAAWIGVLMVLKTLVLEEYRIEFRGFSMVLIGALILAKVVLVLEHVSLGAWSRTQPAWIDVALRTGLYGLGVVVVLLLEKVFDGRHEHGGFGPSLLAVFQHVDIYHVWANAITLSGALLVYNCVSVLQRHLGEGSLMRLFLRPLPEEPHTRAVNTESPSDVRG